MVTGLQKTKSRLISRLSLTKKGETLGTRQESATYIRCQKQKVHLVHTSDPAKPLAPPGISCSPHSRPLLTEGPPLPGVSSAPGPPPHSAAELCGAPSPQLVYAHWLQDCPEVAGAGREENTLSD